MANEFRKYNDITADVISDWKARNGDRLSEVTIETSTGGIARFVIRHPSRSVVDLVAQYGQSKKLVEANKVLTANCVLGGDMEELEQDGSVYTAVLKEIGKLMREKNVTVKKL